MWLFKEEGKEYLGKCVIVFVGGLGGCLVFIREDGGMEMSLLEGGSTLKECLVVVRVGYTGRMCLLF